MISEIVLIAMLCNASSQQQELISKIVLDKDIASDPLSWHVLPVDSVTTIFDNEAGMLQVEHGSRNANRVSKVQIRFQTERALQTLLVDEGCYEIAIDGKVVDGVPVVFFRQNDNDVAVLKGYTINDGKLLEVLSAESRGLFAVLGSGVPKIEELIDRKEAVSFNIIAAGAFRDRGIVARSWTLDQSSMRYRPGPWQGRT